MLTVHFHHAVLTIYLICNLINGMVFQVVVGGPHTIIEWLKLLRYDGYYISIWRIKAFPPPFLSSYILQTKRSHHAEQTNDLSYL